MSAPMLPQAVNSGAVQILPADTTTLKTVVTAGANGTKVVSVNAASNDTAARVLILWRTRAGVDYAIGSTAIPITAGRDAAGIVPPVDLLLIVASLAVDNDGQKYLLLKSGDTLRVSSTSTITAAKQIDVTSDAADL